MTDKILKEAFDKIVGIEEDSGEDMMDGIDELTGIQDAMFELIERLDSAIRAYVPDNHQHWQAYGLAHLKIIAGSDGYGSSNESISTLIDKLTKEAERR